MYMYQDRGQTSNLTHRSNLNICMGRTTEVVTSPNQNGVAPYREVGISPGMVRSLLCHNYPNPSLLASSGFLGFVTAGVLTCRSEKEPSFTAVGGQTAEEPSWRVISDRNNVLLQGKRSQSSTCPHFTKDIRMVFTLSAVSMSFVK